MHLNSLMLTSWVRLVLEYSSFISNSSHVFAFRPNWRCMNDLRVQLCPEDYKVPHASPFSFVNFCKSRIFGNDEGLNPSCSFSLSSSNPLLHSILVVPRIYRDEHHVVYLFFPHEIGDCQLCRILSLSNNSVRTKHAPQVQ